MAEKVLMLALSPTMTEGTIATWNFKEGDYVRVGAVLCEVETDKAVMDYEASASGTLLKIVKPAGEKALVGDLIAVLGKAGENVDAIVASAGAGQGSAAADRATPADKPASIHAATAPKISEPQDTPSSRSVQAAAPASSPSSSAGAFPVLAPGYPKSSPLARSLAKKAGIDLRTLSGSGPAGRVVARDVDAFIASGGSGRGMAPAASSSAPVSPSPSGPKAALEDKVVPVTRLRATVARRLSESMREAPHFFLRSAVDAERLLSFRSAINEGREDKISLNSLFVKLAASAIAKHPAINASWEGDSIRYRKSVDVALAVALPDGLVAPVVRDCASKGIEQIEQEFRALIARAKSGGLKPEDYEGATFTVSNLGAWGVEEFTAIINPPGSAILALGAIAAEPVVRKGPSGEDLIAARQRFRATLSCDHRVIDGAVGAAFLKDLAAVFEEPARALL
jgi:pyruvate dehydrogenase E2 component (dihydrolipoamide acetyltransferase)